MLLNYLNLHDVGHVLGYVNMQIPRFYYFPLIWFGYWKSDLQKYRHLALKASPIATYVLYDLVYYQTDC